MTIEHDGSMRSVFSNQLRTLRHDLPSTLNIVQWEETLFFFHFLCAYCCLQRWQTIDHFVPIVHGGGTTQGNCIPACVLCNQAKGELTDIGKLIALFGAAHIYRVQVHLQQRQSPQERRDEMVRIKQQFRDKTLLDLILAQYGTVERYAKETGIPVKRVRHLATGSCNSVLQNRELFLLAHSLGITQESVRELLYGRV